MANKSGKGSTFERSICTQLSLWFSGGVSDDWFWRTAGSGARATVRGRKGKRTTGHCGDICATCPEAQPFLDYFAVECKKGYSKFTVADLLDKPEGAAKQEYEKWFEQAELSRKNSGAKAWLLIVKRDRRDALVFCPTNKTQSLPIAVLFQGSTITAYCWKLTNWLEGSDPEWFQ